MNKSQDVNAMIFGGNERLFDQNEIANMGTLGLLEWDFIDQSDLDPKDNSLAAGHAPSAHNLGLKELFLFF
jgi:hypothetical protein